MTGDLEWTSCDLVTRCHNCWMFVLWGFPVGLWCFFPINRNGLNSPRKNDDLELLEMLPSNDFLRLWGIVVWWLDVSFFKVLQLRPYMVWPLTVFFFKGVLMMYIANFTQKYPWAPASWIGIWHRQHKQKPRHPLSLQKLFKNFLILSLSVSHKYMPQYKNRDDDVSKTY